MTPPSTLPPPPVEPLAFLSNLLAPLIELYQHLVTLDNVVARALAAHQKPGPQLTSEAAHDGFSKCVALADALHTYAGPAMSELGQKKANGTTAAEAGAAIRLLPDPVVLVKLLPKFVQYQELLDFLRKYRKYSAEQTAQGFGTDILPPTQDDLPEVPPALLNAIPKGFLWATALKIAPSLSAQGKLPENALSDLPDISSLLERLPREQNWVAIAKFASDVRAGIDYHSKGFDESDETSDSLLDDLSGLGSDTEAGLEGAPPIINQLVNALKQKGISVAIANPAEVKKLLSPTKLQGSGDSDSSPIDGETVFRPKAD